MRKEEKGKKKNMTTETENQNQYDIQLIKRWKGIYGESEKTAPS